MVQQREELIPRKKNMDYNETITTPTQGATVNPIKKAALGTKNFVVAHQTSIAIVTTAAATAVIAKKAFGKAYAVADQFITEKGLAEEFLTYVPNNLDV